MSSARAFILGLSICLLLPLVGLKPAWAMPLVAGAVASEVGTDRAEASVHPSQGNSATAIVCGSDAALEIERPALPEGAPSLLPRAEEGPLIGAGHPAGIFDPPRRG